MRPSLHHSAERWSGAARRPLIDTMDPARPPDRLPDDGMQCEPRAKSCMNGCERVESGAVSYSSGMCLPSRGNDAGSPDIVAGESGPMGRATHQRLRSAMADRESRHASQAIVGPDDASGDLVSGSLGSCASSVGKTRDSGDGATGAIWTMRATSDSPRDTRGPVAPTRHPMPPARRPRTRSHDPSAASNAERLSTRRIAVCSQMVSGPANHSANLAGYPAGGKPRRGYDAAVIPSIARDLAGQHRGSPRSSPRYARDDTMIR
jgi:hypothetical protein